MNRAVVPLWTGVGGPSRLAFNDLLNGHPERC